jgi:hypothetical protein
MAGLRLERQAAEVGLELGHPGLPRLRREEAAEVHDLEQPVEIFSQVLHGPVVAGRPPVLDTPRENCAPGCGCLAAPCPKSPTVPGGSSSAVDRPRSASDPVLK